MKFLTITKTNFAITTAFVLCLGTYSAIASHDLTSGSTAISSNNSDSYNFNGGDIQILTGNSYTLSGALTFTQNGTISCIGTSILTLSGESIIGNSNTLIKSSAGTLVLGQSATSLSNIQINAGTLQFSNASYLPSTITLNGGTLSPTAALTLSNSITLIANSSLAVGTGITLTLSGCSITGDYVLTLSGTGTVELGESAYALSEIIVSADTTLKLINANRKIKKITNNGTLNLNGNNLYITDTDSTLGTVIISNTESIYLGDNNTSDSETITLSQTMSAPLVIESGNKISVTNSITLPKITVGSAIDSSGVTG